MLRFLAPRSILPAVRDATLGVLVAVTALNLALPLVHGAPAGWFWIDLRVLPPALATGVLLAFVLSVTGAVIFRHSIVDGLARGLCGVLALACLKDTVTVLRLILGDLSGGWPVPASLLFTCVLAAWALRPAHRASRGARLARLALAPGLALAGILCVALLFGSTDYRRPADAIVTFGAKVHADGTPSMPLFDRTRSAVALYQQGLANRLIFSGAKSAQAPISEPVAMRRIALDMGVPEEAILLDEAGTNTLASIRNVAVLGEEHGIEHWLMVSHGYHLARIKLFSERHGLDTATVPADETRWMRRYPFFLAREVAALLWWYPSGATFGCD